MGLGFSVFVLLEVVLRIAGVADGQDYVPPRLVQVVNNGKLEGEFVQNNVPYFVQRGEWVETHPQYHRGIGEGFPASGSMRKVRFSAAPTPDIERYFLLGGSAALGQHPVDVNGPITWSTYTLGKGVDVLPDHLSIAGQVQNKLRLIGRSAEVINIGMIAQDSGGVRRIALEALKYNPTGLLIYLGNNESIGMAYGMKGEKLPWVPEVRSRLRDIRLYRVLSDQLVPTKQRSAAKPITLQGTAPTVLGQLTQTQWRAAGKALIDNKTPTDSVYAALQKRLAENLSIIVNAAHDQGVAVYILPTPPNLNYPPFYDANSPNLGESDIQKYTALIGQAKQFERQQKWSDMEITTTKAVQIETNHATGWYMLGSALQQQSKFSEAIKARERALALDISRKRTLPVYASVIEELCDEKCKTMDTHSNVLSLISDQGLIAYTELWGDHEHLTPKGCEMISDMFIDLMTRSQN